jgi:hypothetical protein
LVGSVGAVTEEEVFDSPAGWVAKHIKRYAASDGDSGYLYMGVPTLLLTTRGRRTGKLRRTALMYGENAGRELFDRPEAPRPDPDTPAPVRFLYDFDNLPLGHDDRSRVGSDTHAKIDFGERMEMPATFLVDGMTAGMWKCVVRRQMATMTLAPLVPLEADTEADLTAEADRLAAFLAPTARERRVTVVAGGWDAILALTPGR